MSPMVYGVGSTVFGRQPRRTAPELAWEAALAALADAGVAEVDAAFVGAAFAPAGIAQRALEPLGLGGIPMMTVTNACASGSTALYEAYSAVKHGRYERVLAIGVDHVSRRFSGGIHPERADADGATGLAFPGIYAMAATRYLGLGLATAEQLAAVSVKNHRNAIGNPIAQYGMDCTVDKVLASRMIADPLTLLQCCPISDGAAAAVIGPHRGRSSDVPVRGMALRSGGRWDYTCSDVWSFDQVAQTAAQAFDAAGVGPADVDVFEVHDAFTISEVITVEALGLAEVGEGATLAPKGVTAIDGQYPVNPSGGLLSRGHPIGATGLAQLAEIVWQLRGTAARQVDGARLGVMETMGGGVAGIDGDACVVGVLG